MLSLKQLSFATLITFSLTNADTGINGDNNKKRTYISIDLLVDSFVVSSSNPEDIFINISDHSSAQVLRLDGSVMVFPNKKEGEFSFKVILKRKYDELILKEQEYGSTSKSADLHSLANPSYSIGYFPSWGDIASYEPSDCIEAGQFLWLNEERKTEIVKCHVQQLRKSMSPPVVLIDVDEQIKPAMDQIDSSLQDSDIPPFDQPSGKGYSEMVAFDLPLFNLLDKSIFYIKPKGLGLAKPLGSFETALSVHAIYAELIFDQNPITDQDRFELMVIKNIVRPLTIDQLYLLTLNITGNQIDHRMFKRQVIDDTGRILIPVLHSYWKETPDFISVAKKHITDQRIINAIEPLQEEHRRLEEIKEKIYGYILKSSGKGTRVQPPEGLLENLEEEVRVRGTVQAVYNAVKQGDEALVLEILSQVKDDFNKDDLSKLAKLLEVEDLLKEIAHKHHMDYFSRRYDHETHRMLWDETEEEKEQEYADTLVDFISTWMSNKKPTVETLINALRTLFPGMDIQHHCQFIYDSLSRRGRI